MEAALSDYVPLVGDGVVSELRLLGERLAASV